MIYRATFMEFATLCPMLEPIKRKRLDCVRRCDLPESTDMANNGRRHPATNRARALGGFTRRLRRVPPFILAALAWSAADAITLQVPEDFATIQGAISAAQDGDAVLVAPGTYTENINFLGKAISVKSVQGSGLTRIDGNLVDVVAKFVSGETRNSVLSGFTLTHGFLSAIKIGFNSSPTIFGNVLVDNRVCPGAGAIQILTEGSPLIRDNVIDANRCDPGMGGYGIDIAILGGSLSSPQIFDNVISNHWDSGIYINSGGTAIIRGNTITGNGGAYSGNGGGIAIYNDSDVDIINNVIVGNTAPIGGGIYWGVPLGNRGPLLVNNTIAGNDSVQGVASGIAADGFDSQAMVVNNIIVGKSGQSAVACFGVDDPNPPNFRFNDVFSPSGTPYVGTCVGQAGQFGNISTDPSFVGPSTGDFHLRAASVAINAGTNAAPDLPATDKDNRPRILGGIVDMGAFEFSSQVAYTPLTPCRILDSRNATLASGVLGPILGSALYHIPGFNAGGQNWAQYGGSGTSNCGLTDPPGSAILALAIVVTVLNPNFDAYMGISDVNDLGTVLSTVAMNYAQGQGLSTMYIVPQVSTNNIYFALPTGLSAQLIFDIVGYYVASDATALQCIAQSSLPVPIDAGASLSAVSPACAVGYTLTSGSCNSTSASLNPSQHKATSGNTAWLCTATNRGGSSASLTATANCCRVPGN